MQGVGLIHLAPGVRRHRPGPDLVAPIVVVATAEQQDLAVALVDRHAREGGNPTGGLSHGRCGTNLYPGGARNLGVEVSEAEARGDRRSAKCCKSEHAMPAWQCRSGHGRDEGED